MTDLDDARRAYEAAKRISAYEAENGIFQSDACVIKAIATTTYEAAMLADAQAKLDAMGVVIGETLVDCGADWEIVRQLEADVVSGRVKAYLSKMGDWASAWAWTDTIRPYVAPVVKEMVLYGPSHDGLWCEHNDFDTHKLTLSGITLADLDGMTGPITGTYTVEKL